MNSSRYVLGLDIGSNSIGSAWIDLQTGRIETGLSVFPAGVDETDDKRGDPKNVKRRMARRTRITLARRASRKRELRALLIDRGLLPRAEAEFRELLEKTDPWQLRRNGLDRVLSPHEFGRVLLHLSQRRGAIGLRETMPDAPGEDEDGKVKAAIGAARAAMLQRRARSFGEFMHMLGCERRTPIQHAERRAGREGRGVNEWRSSIRNRSGNYEFAADRAMIRDEFSRLWAAQRGFGGPLSMILTDQLRLRLDDPERRAWDADPNKSPAERAWYRDTYREGGVLFGQRRATWDMGTLGRCVLEPTERCASHADRHASYFRVVETVNNLRIVERGHAARPLNADERAKILHYLRGPLGTIKAKKKPGMVDGDRPKTTVTVTDLRQLMGWGKATKNSQYRFNIEADEDREINTDWFHRSIVHGVFTEPVWGTMSEAQRESVNRAVLKFDPDRPEHAERLAAGASIWWGLSPEQVQLLTVAWKSRPPIEKRVNLSRRAIRNLLAVMDREWPDADEGRKWITQIEARKLIASDEDFRDVTTGEPLHPRARPRYATGAKGLSSRDRHYMAKHPGSLPPAPMLTNPVVRKAIHEVRRHIMAHIQKQGRKPDRIVIELAREAKMSAKESDRTLLRNRLRDRIRKDILGSLDLGGLKPNQQRAAVDRVILSIQQGGVCPLCANLVVKDSITARMAAYGEGCELAHIVPRGIGGSNGLNNLVVAHTKCNRDMGRRTPRQWWGDRFDEAFVRVAQIYENVERIEPKQARAAADEKLWSAYFSKHDDEAKLLNFKKSVQDIQGHTDRDLSDTRYATRQVMAYLADALYEGKGLPERGGDRLIFTTDGRWTGELRREWGLFRDVHEAKGKGLSNAEEHSRKEKNRGDHRHHALDAVVVALADRAVQIKFEERAKAADAAGITAEQFDRFCRDHPVNPPGVFASADDLRTRAIAAIFGDDANPKPVCHRPVKRKLVGRLHKETLYGPVVEYGSTKGSPLQMSENRVTIRQDVIGETLSDCLKPSHLRLPRRESDDELAKRISLELLQSSPGMTRTDAKREALRRVTSGEVHHRSVDVKPEKGGVVRDIGLRRILRQLIAERGLDPDAFTPGELRTSIRQVGPISLRSGVPIHAVRLLWANEDPVVVSRFKPDFGTIEHDNKSELKSPRMYDSQNNHHIELRASEKGVWSGEIVTTFDAAQRKRQFFRALREAGVPTFKKLRDLPLQERRKYAPVISSIDRANQLVDRSDDPAKGGRFVMSLCEGETLMMRHKLTKEVGYFIVAKLDKPQSVVLVPHWDARTATPRKDAFGNKVFDSERDSFAATPSDFKTLGAPGHAHAVKVRVTPLGEVEIIERD